jgi:carboxyl-terminal processing protease
MLVSALADVERKVPEFMVDSFSTRNEIRSVNIRVGDEEREFSLARVHNLYTLSWKLLDIFEFVAPRLTGTIAGQEIEYAAINGLLRVLDPHSILLTPSIYREMKLGTTGKFGGLGIVITQRDGRLVIQSVMEGTPARGAGLKSGDIITQIAAESTVNMTLNEAVKRLRGKAGTSVTLWIERKSSSEPLKYQVTRANITLASVTSKLIEGGVGYARIKNFQQNTAGDLQTAIRRMSTEREHTSGGALMGLILDLRDNPGGLLDQAIQVSNLFITDGTIVTTVGSGNKVREEKVASVADTWADLPVAILVNQGSASASEIVAGALRNHNRALIIGEQTFGKGSVQVIYDIEKAALKLTVAQYLTPGDESIQSVGITPHFELSPVAITEERVHLNLKKRRGETELENHLSNKRTKQHTPSAQIGYLLEDTADSDFAMDLAKRVLAAHGSTSAQTMLEAATVTLNSMRAQQTQRIVEALGKLDVDWSTGRNPRKPSLVARLKASTAKLQAGEKTTLTLEVENTGKKPVFRVRGRSKAESAAFNALDFPIGHIPAGQRRRFTQTVHTSRSMPSELINVAVDLHFGEDRNVIRGVKASSAAVQVAGLKRPRFGYAVQVLDHEKGNGDGLISSDESVTLRVRISNVGEGSAYKTLATLKNRGGDEVFITQGREWIQDIPPGQSKTVDFKLKIQGDVAETGLEVDLQITDSVLRQRMTHTLDLPIAKKPNGSLLIKPSQWVTERTTPYRGTAYSTGPTLGEFTRGTPLYSDARVGDWLRVPVESWGYVWVSRGNLIEAPPGVVVPQKASVDVPIAVLQPHVEITNLPGLETSASKLSLDGQAHFPSAKGVRPDLYIFRDDDKVFFRRATQLEAKSIPFDADIPLSPGRNVLSIHARAGRDLLYKMRFTVQRRN